MAGKDGGGTLHCCGRSNRTAVLLRIRQHFSHHDHDDHHHDDDDDDILPTTPASIPPPPPQDREWSSARCVVVDMPSGGSSRWKKGRMPMGRRRRHLRPPRKKERMRAALAALEKREKKNGERNRKRMRGGRAEGLRRKLGGRKGEKGGRSMMRRKDRHRTPLPRKKARRSIGRTRRGCEKINSPTRPTLFCPRQVHQVVVMGSGNPMTPHGQRRSITC